MYLNDKNDKNEELNFILFYFILYNIKCLLSVNH